MKTFRCRDAGWLFSVASGLLMLLMLFSTSHASEVRHLWQSRDQFVALERRDSAAGAAALSNDHPREISPDRLAAMLASITFHSADSGRPEQLLTNQSLEVLVPELVQGFRNAASGDDVTFAIIGLYTSKLGFAKSPKVTTGRAFYTEGRLNIIFGFAQKDFNEREDRRLSPFIPGDRQKPLEGEWSLLPQPGQKGFTLVRNDWVTFSDEWRAPDLQPPADRQKVPSLQTRSAQPLKLQAPVAGNDVPAVQPPLVQPGTPNIDTRTAAGRLTTLKELKDQGLITEDEYRSKRSEILNGL